MISARTPATLRACGGRLTGPSVPHGRPAASTIRAHPRHPPWSPSPGAYRGGVSFLPDPAPEALEPAQQAAWNRFAERHPGRLTNMKAVLLHNLPAFEAYMEWYTLADELAGIIGDRGVNLFSSAISEANECLVCSVFFRRILIDSGEDPDDLRTTPEEDVLMAFGRAIATTPGAIPSELRASVEATWSAEARLVLVAFAGQMVATNLLNTVGQVPLDEILYEYRRAGDARVR